MSIVNSQDTVLGTVGDIFVETTISELSLYHDHGSGLHRSQRGFTKQ